jgi:L-amino acid N-acyltransferase YncA
MHKVRFANQNDVSLIRDIFNDVIENTTAIYQNTLRTKEQIDEWFQVKTQNDWPVFIIEMENQAVGFATYGPFRAGECYKHTVELAIHLKKEWRGRGLGSRLLEFLIQNVKDRGFHSIMAGIDSANASSIKLHEKFGFKIVGEIKQVGHKFDRWLDLTMMQLILE